VPKYLRFMKCLPVARDCFALCLALSYTPRDSTKKGRSGGLSL